MLMGWSGTTWLGPGVRRMATLLTHGIPFMGSQGLPNSADTLISGESIFKWMRLPKIYFLLVPTHLKGSPVFSYVVLCTLGVEYQ